MKRTTISLGPRLAAILNREARRRGTSVSQVARDALGTHFGIAGDHARTVPFAGVARSGQRDTAAEAEKILEREWADRIRGEHGSARHS